MCFYNLFFIIILSFFHTDIYSISPESNFSSSLESKFSSLSISIELVLQSQACMNEPLCSLYEKGSPIYLEEIGGNIRLLDGKYAIKRISKNSYLFGRRRHTYTDFFKKKILKLNHPHIYKVYDKFGETVDSWYYSAPYYPESFSSYFSGLEGKKIQIFLLKILLTLKYLQENNISIHYLEKENIRVSEDKVFKIIALDLIQEKDKEKFCIFTAYFLFVYNLRQDFELNTTNNFFEKCTKFQKDLGGFVYPVTDEFEEFSEDQKRVVTNEIFKKILAHSFFDEVRDEQEIIDLVAFIPRNNKGRLPEGLERYEGPLKKSA